MKDKSVLIVLSAEGRESGQREDVVPVEAGLAVVPDQVETVQVFEMLESSALAKMELAIKSNKNKQRLEVFIRGGKYLSLI